MRIKTEQFYKAIQAGVIILIWGILFILPIFNTKGAESLSWEAIFSGWSMLMPFFILFLFNRFVLLPLFFFKNKKAWFLIINTCLILFASVFVSDDQILNRSDRSVLNEDRVERMHFSRDQELEGMPGRRLDMPSRNDNEFVKDSMPPIQASGERMRRPRGNEMPGGPRGNDEGPSRNAGMHPGDSPHANPQPPLPMPPFLSFIVIAILMIAADTGLLIVSQWEKAERERINVEKESTDNKMAFLRSQVSPHFFMNTLNNIHALIDFSKEEAQDAIIRLSKLMGYMLYETQSGNVSLKKEIDFVGSYLELMRLRISDKVEINLDVPQNFPEINVPPLLTISYIENAFKYGVSYQEKSHIFIKFEVQGDKLYFEVENSNHAKKKKIQDDSNSGLGMINAKKRLDLIYGEAYNLDIEESSHTFKVKLKIPSC